LLFGGIYRVVQLFKARHKRKAAIVRANEVKTVFQRRWFWTKFAMSVAIALLSQFQLIDAGILKDDIIPVLVVADSLRAVGWVRRGTVPPMRMWWTSVFFFYPLYSFPCILLRF
jgi:hypothetical protein